MENTFWIITSAICIGLIGVIIGLAVAPDKKINTSGASYVPGSHCIINVDTLDKNLSWCRETHENYQRLYGR